MTRRAFLQAAGIAGASLVAAGAGWSHREGVFSVGEGPAYEPWRSWRTDEAPLALIRAAVLAANPHNTQPWLFKIANERIEIYADTVRNLGTFDPYLREMHIGLGCALENMVLAAAAHGYAPKVTLVDGTLEPISAAPRPSLIATIDLAPGPARQDELYAAIPRRHTNRAPYDRGRAIASFATVRRWIPPGCLRCSRRSLKSPRRRPRNATIATGSMPRATCRFHLRPSSA